MSVLDPPPFPPPSLPVVAPHWPLHTAQLLEHKRNGSAVSQAPGGAAPALLLAEHLCLCLAWHVQTLHGNIEHCVAALVFSWLLQDLD